MIRKRILIYRPDNIGDVFLFTGALRHIRNLYPYSHITLAVQAHIVNLVELCPYINDCIPVDNLFWLGKIEHKRFPFKRRIIESLPSMNRRWNLICRPFDTIIYPVKSPNISHLEVIDFLNAKQTFGILGSNLNISQNGFPSELQPHLLFKKHLDISKFDPWIHEFETNLNFLIFMGCNAITLNDIRPVFWLANLEINHLHSIQTHGRKIIGLFPGASSVEKRWDSNNYGMLAKQMEGQIIYVIFGSSADKDLTDQVAHSIKKCCEDVEILNMTGQTTLRELAKTIMSCDLLISMDTFALHMAIAAGVPTIGIVGGGHYGRFVPWGNTEKNIFLTKKMDCFNCNWICIHEEAECVKGVSPQEVAITATKLFKQHNFHAKNNELQS